MEVKQWHYRWSATLGGGFSGTPEEVWGVKKYNPIKHINEPTVFCGLYGLKDFFAMWQHKGTKAIWWAGSDIRYFLAGYWFDKEGKIRVYAKTLAPLLNEFDNWVENTVEQQALAKVGVESKVCPSFLGNVDNYQPQKLSKELRYYSSVSGNDFKLYGWDKINKLAKKNPDITYYLYGNTIPWEAPKNVIVRGRMSQSKMDNETKTMTGAIRLLPFEGCSELIVKSVLWGQQPISAIDYPWLNDRNKLLKIVNRYLWNTKI